MLEILLIYIIIVILHNDIAAMNGTHCVIHRLYCFTMVCVCCVIYQCMSICRYHYITSTWKHIQSILNSLPPTNAVTHCCNCMYSAICNPFIATNQVNRLCISMGRMLSYYSSNQYVYIKDATYTDSTVVYTVVTSIELFVTICFVKY